MKRRVNNPNGLFIILWNGFVSSQRFKLVLIDHYYKIRLHAIAKNKPIAPTHHQVEEKQFF